MKVGVEQVLQLAEHQQGDYCRWKIQAHQKKWKWNPCSTKKCKILQLWIFFSSLNPGSPKKYKLSQLWHVFFQFLFGKPHRALTNEKSCGGELLSSILQNIKVADRKLFVVDTHMYICLKNEIKNKKLNVLPRVLSKSRSCGEEVFIVVAI